MAEIDQPEAFELAVFGCIDGIGRRTLRKIVKYRSNLAWSWSELWVPSAEVTQFLSLTTKQVLSIQNTQREQVSAALGVAIERHSLRLITPESTEYPPLLCEGDDPPPVLFVKGALMSWPLELVPVAVVGTRNITPYGKMATEKISGELVALGAVIISGLMYGVDTTAHLAAVAAGGSTVAVLGYGFDHCYPEEHRSVLDALLSKGATFISEYPPWKIAKKGNFPARNSIVAGMSAAVVVTEAATKSGSMITAQCAVEEGRAVCAVPGPITNPYCEGTKWLINEGATLVSSGSEVMDQIYRPVTHFTSSSMPQNPARPSKARIERDVQISAIGKRIIASLTAKPMSMDELISVLDLSSESIAVETSLLELDGLIYNHAGNITITIH